MRANVIVGYITAVKGVGIAKLAGFLQGILLFRPVADWLMWIGYPLAFLMMVGGLWLATAGEDE